MKTLVRVIIMGGVLMSLTALPAFSDEPGAPPPPSEHGVGGNQGPAGAPIDGGLGILLSIGAVYGCKKYLASKKTNIAKETVSRCEKAEPDITGDNAS